MNQSKRFYRDVFTGITFTTGVFVFMSGDFLTSTLLFCLASVVSNIQARRRYALRA
jgi:hypothetical protein